MQKRKLRTGDVVRYVYITPKGPAPFYGKMIGRITKVDSLNVYVDVWFAPPDVPNYWLDTGWNPAAWEVLNADADD